MSAPVAVLRPEPGNTATAERIAAIGLTAVRLPLFEVQSVPWAVDRPGRYDALVFASANALRLGGGGLATLRHLPVFAVGEATADAARAAGFDVIATGDGGAAALIDVLRANGIRHALHLGGRERTISKGGPIGQTITVYESLALPIAPAALRAIEGSVALLHSARAAARLDALATPGFARNLVRIAAISDAVAAAAGDGWCCVTIAPSPTDQALLATARTLAD